MFFCYSDEGLRIEWNNTSYSNNSEIAITVVGEKANAVKCRTDSENCCAVENNRQGEWHYPNNSLVDNAKSGDDIYRTRGNMVVNLNRRNDATQPTGLYCCEVPMAAHSNARACIHLNISE